MTTYSLLELNTFLRQAIALNFPEPLWVTAEIAQVSEVRGHLFLELVQKSDASEGAIAAQMSAVLWQPQYRQLSRRAGERLANVLCEGREVCLEVRVDFHERYGLKLFVLNVDSAYTIGRLALQRQHALKVLREEGLLMRNRSLPLPQVLQRIAVISSEGAVGLQDFQEHLRQNPFGFAFYCQLFPTAVQGDSLEKEFLQALERVAAQAEDFDCAVVLRGGGARLDLSGFDTLAVCRAAAQLPLPLLTGIGHETDETVLDQVAYAALKTPTALADFILQRNLFFEGDLLELGAAVRTHTQHHLRQHYLALTHSEAAAQWAARARLRGARQQVSAAAEAVFALAQQTTRSASERLQRAEALCSALHPEATLRRGFSLTLKDGRVVTSVKAVQPGDILQTRLQDGTFCMRASDS